jgi:transposase-like protein
VQRIYPCELAPEQYVQSSAHQQVIPESVCPRCGQAGPLHRHGTYARGLTNLLGQVLLLLIARFLCPACRRTLSYLPSFALSYRLVAAPTVQAFLEGEHQRRDVQTWWTVLRSYRRRMEAFAPELIRTVGAGLGRAPPAPAALGPWLKKACGSLQAATRQLVTEFRITLFARYQCHQPARR